MGGCCVCAGAGGVVVDGDGESVWERFLREKRPRRPRLTWATASGAAAGGDDGQLCGLVVGLRCLG